MQWNLWSEVLASYKHCECVLNRKEFFSDDIFLSKRKFHSLSDLQERFFQFFDVFYYLRIL